MGTAGGREFDFRRLRTYSVRRRRNLVSLSDLVDPSAAPPSWDHPELEELVDRLAASIRRGSKVVVFSGAHVVKAGLSPFLLRWLKRRWVSHLAANGAFAIHDFELALVGGTSEDVAEGLTGGTFGMWEETGRFMHEALREGRERGWGFGESIGAYLDRNEARFLHRNVSVLWQAYRLGIPVTIHVTIGGDIIHQHPEVDFAAVGEASGRDFKICCSAVSELEGGAFLNLGSAVTGPEVFLKALVVARNAGCRVANFTTANFDIYPLGDYRNARVDGTLRPEYFYRPWKNIVVRPPAEGGKGFHIEGDLREAIPSLHDRLRRRLCDCNGGA